MTEPAVAGQPYPRAALRVAGASLAQHQLGLALALKCHRIICLAREVSPEVIAVQRLAEDAGVQFYIASGPRQVCAQVNACDDFIMITEGLFADPAGVVPMVEAASNVVLVQPVEGAQTAGFERIDLNRCAAGLARLPGSLVERLCEVPDESDTISILTRIALQSRAEMREVPATFRTGVSWRLIRSEAEAIEIEREWLNQQFTGPGLHSPGRLLAQYGALAFGASLLQVGRASNVISVAVVALLALAAFLAWLGVTVPGFVCAGVAWIMIEAGRRLRAAERRPLGVLVPAIERADAMIWLVDLALVGLVLAATAAIPGQSVLTWFFAPVTLFLLLTLAPRTLDARTAAWIGDRAVLALVLAVATVFGQVLTVVQVVALLILVAQLLLVKRP
ncbi:hypothetical protein HT136_15320 [Novosphingobium profundi]|uniref:hypothetical protein n=1 Tax=Novosphingobium profundi TaxID=1774954 RepID=UPI001BDAD5C2|nr:hypothetical protein [Novosphingobium profundi]MBT0669738.1 hypothetical protein [Novosphingobium profundi]